ncbi:TPA: DUF2971 domain-containing protein [Aeromonas veronii]
METYYKYSGLMPLSFFRRPTIKISVPAHLNDPFERYPSRDILKALEQHSASIDSELYSGDIDNMIQCNGVVSLSETQRNSLMWAHYGDHHKGMCIGFTKETIKERHVDTLEGEEFLTYYCLPILTPRKVNYDNIRFDLNKRFSSTELTHEVFLRHLFTKSDEWIYEKEHRCIVPFIYATHVLITNGEEKRYIKVNGAMERMTLHRVISKLSKAEFLIKEKEKNLYRLNENLKSIPLLSELAEFQNLNFLYEIEPKDMIEVHFGCKVKKDKIKEIYDEVKTDGHPLNHLKMYAMSTNNKRFELNQQEINEDFFDELDW